MFRENFRFYKMYWEHFFPSRLCLFKTIIDPGNPYTQAYTVFISPEFYIPFSEGAYTELI